jgi:hypothetical protein
MTRRATFGDFSASAAQHLLRLQRTWPSAGPDRAGSADVVADLSRAVHALTCYADDAVRVLDADQLARDRQLGIWVRAATQTREALVTAEAALPVAPGPDDGTSPRRPHWESDDLRGATHSMMLGRDLLHTHDAIPTGRLVSGGSEWTPVVSSAPVTCAVLHEAGGWTRRIAGHAYRVSSAAGCPEAERRILSAAGKTLSQVSWAVGAAQERRPVRQGQLRLLHAIPVNTIPEPCLPAGGDSVAGLTAGVISTAERLRVAARHGSAEPPWSRQLTRETLRQTAGCCAISASSLQIMLSTLAAQHGSPDTHASASLAAAADAGDRARAAWLAVTESWNSITTDTRGAMGPAGTEAAALALWTGRLAYASPDWTPNLGPHHQPRQAGELAADTDQLRAAVDAAHHIAHTLTQVAEADRDHVRIAAMAGRLIVPTRSLPDEYDVPYRFAPAPPSSTDPLQSSYDRALRASEEATAAMAQVAAEMQADSRVLTIARAATRGDPSAWAGRPIRDMTPDLGRSREHGSPVATRHPKLAPPGPVERTLLELEISNKPDLQQAAAIDKAADQLILRAAITARPSQPTRDLGHSADGAEVIERFVATNDCIPARLGRREPVRQVEFEAGA